MPVFASVNETPERVVFVPLLWLTQVAPPSVVRRIVPLSPTAVPVFAPVNDTPESPKPVPLVWPTQVVPPSIVRRIVPNDPRYIFWVRAKISRKSCKPYAEYAGF